jgi:hypothetical protein
MALALHGAAHVLCACTVCTGAAVSTVVEIAAPTAVLSELKARLDHFVDFFSSM